MLERHILQGCQTLLLYSIGGVFFHSLFVMTRKKKKCTGSLYIGLLVGIAHPSTAHVLFLHRRQQKQIRHSLTAASYVRSTTRRTSSLFSTTSMEGDYNDDDDDDDDWISLLPRRHSQSLPFLSVPSFQAFVRGETSICYLPSAFLCDDTSTTTITTIASHESSSENGRRMMISSIQDDARMLRALGFGVTAGVVHNPRDIPMIRQGVTQLWLQTPSDLPESVMISSSSSTTTASSSSSSSSSSIPSILAGNLEGRTQLFRLVEGLRSALEEQQPTTSKTAIRCPSPTTPIIPNLEGSSAICIPRNLPPDQVELSYLWYDGTAQGYYGRHIDTPQITKTKTQMESSSSDQSNVPTRVRCVSFLLYLGGITDEPWDVKEDGGQLRIFLEPSSSSSSYSDLQDDDNDDDSDNDTVSMASNGDDDDDDDDSSTIQTKDTTEERYMDIIPEVGTLVLFDSAIVPHEVLPTRRDRLAVVGWFGTIV